MRTAYAVLILTALLGGCPSDDDDCTAANDSSSGESKGAFGGGGTAKPCADESKDGGTDDEPNSPSSGNDKGDAIGSIGSIGGRAGASGGKAGSSGGKAGSSGGDSGAGGSSGGDSGSSGGSGDSEEGADFGMAADGLDAALCECEGLDLDECTGVSDSERACQNNALLNADAAASAWLGCAADLLNTALSCVSAAECNVSKIQSCPVLSGESVADEIFAECGAPPTSLAEGIGACSPDTGSSGGPAPSGSACGLPAAVCDGEVDCSDGSDETNCFMCQDGSSIPGEWVCDNEDDCTNGEDESAGNCPSSSPSMPAPPSPDPVPPPPSSSGPTPSPAQ